MNLPISLDESNAGLVPPAVATVLMGAGGGFLLVFQVRMSKHHTPDVWHVLPRGTRPACVVSQTRGRGQRPAMRAVFARQHCCHSGI
jgi:hypothetical protein